jgi:hypothetical protein
MATIQKTRGNFLEDFRPGALLRHKGGNLPFPGGFLPMATPVMVQLSNDTPGACWQTTHVSTGPLINTLDQYKSVSEGPTP